jgi:Na+:H+ antiporter, NhaA family
MFDKGKGMGSPASGSSPNTFQRFFQSEVSGSILLLACSAIALIWANSPWADSYHHVLHEYIGLDWGPEGATSFEDVHKFRMSLHHWVNDGLMAIFFFVVGLEIKRELLVGELSSLKKSALPVGAALGGMLVPALLFTFLNFGGPGMRGWGIPMATDIAFALGALSLFGSRVPVSLKVFLTALAIVDDLGAVVVIAIFYTDTISIMALAVAAAFLSGIFVANRMNVRHTGIYLLLAVAVWVAVLASGVHTTIAGTLIALLVPVRAKIDPREYLKLCRARLDELEAAEFTRDSMIGDQKQLEDLSDIYVASEDMIPAGINLEHRLHPITTFIILPLFALLNAGVPIDIESLSGAPITVGLGVMLGLIVGKQIGVMLFSWLAIRSGLAAMPAGVTWGQLWGISCLAGVGFTMSLFVSGLAFTDQAFDSQSKLGVLTASAISGVLGYIVLHKKLAPAVE